MEELIARAQRLADAPRPLGGHALAWHIEASSLGDPAAIATTALRAAGPSPGSLAG